MSDQPTVKTGITFQQTASNAFGDAQNAANSAPESCIPCAAKNALASQTLAAAGGSSGGDPKCSEILENIKRLLNGLIQRGQELLDDPLGLQWDHWSIPKGKLGSVESHQKSFRERQNGLRNEMNKWDRNNCDDPDAPSKLPEGAREWAKEPAPDPIPRPRPSEDTSKDSSSSSLLDKVLVAVAVLGLSILLVPEILAALVDPEPATKLALIGLSAVTIAKLLELTGNSPKGT